MTKTEADATSDPVPDEDDIEVTSEMAEAGMAVMMHLGDSGDSYNTQCAILAEAYRAMEKVRRAAKDADCG